MKTNDPVINNVTKQYEQDLEKNGLRPTPFVVNKIQYQHLKEYEKATKTRITVNYNGAEYRVPYVYVG